MLVVYPENDYLCFTETWLKIITPVYWLLCSNYKTANAVTRQKIVAKNCWWPLTSETTGPFVIVIVVLINQYIDRKLKFWPHSDSLPFINALNHIIVINQEYSEEELLAPFSQIHSLWINLKPLNLPALCITPNRLSQKVDDLTQQSNTRLVLFTFFRLREVNLPKLDHNKRTVLL